MLYAVHLRGWYFMQQIPWIDQNNVSLSLNTLSLSPKPICSYWKKQVTTIYFTFKNRVNYFPKKAVKSEKAQSALIG